MRNLTLDSSHKRLAQDLQNTLRAETPDLIAYAALGFHFNPTQLHQSDHGGISFPEVRNVFMMSDGSNDLNQELTFNPIPVLTRDLTPTILDITGHKPESPMDGESMLPYYIMAR